MADKTGPLTAGEIDRVKKWAGTIAGKAWLFVF